METTNRSLTEYTREQLEAIPTEQLAAELDKLSDEEARHVRLKLSLKKHSQLVAMSMVDHLNAKPEHQATSAPE